MYSGRSRLSRPIGGKLCGPDAHGVRLLSVRPCSFALERLTKPRAPIQRGYQCNNLPIDAPAKRDHTCPRNSGTRVLRPLSDEVLLSASSYSRTALLVLNGNSPMEEIP